MKQTVCLICFRYQTTLLDNGSDIIDKQSSLNGFGLVAYLSDNPGHSDHLYQQVNIRTGSTLFTPRLCFVGVTDVSMIMTTVCSLPAQTYQTIRRMRDEIFLAGGSIPVDCWRAMSLFCLFYKNSIID